MKTIKVPYQLWKNIKQVALNEDKTISQIIEIAFNLAFGEKKGVKNEKE